MSEPDHKSTSTPFRRYLLAAVAFVLFALLLVLAASGGYLIGRRGDSPAASINLTTGLPVASATPEPTIEAPTATKDIEDQSRVAQQIDPQDSVTTFQTVTPTAEPAQEVEPTVEAQPSEESQATTTNNPEEIDLSTFHEVWRLIERDFDGDIPAEKERLYAAISGSLEVLDDEYTRFVRPEIAELLRDDLDGSISGIGAIVRPTDDGLVEIVRPLDAQPAAQAGIKPGDLIIAVDGQSIRDMNFDEVLLLVRGAEGTVVALTIEREGEEYPQDFSIVRAEFDVPVVEAELIEEGDRPIAYVKLSKFTQAASGDLQQALTELLVHDPLGVIFDLRDNGGGYLDQAVAVADLFLSDGVVLYERSSNGLDETFNSDAGDIAENLPLVVLVNAGSASASEIVAGAIKDNNRGILIGENTLGKGSVQHVLTLEDGSELRVTIARWFTPNNQLIGENGIAPDLEIASPDQLGGPDDTQLERAIEYLVNGE